jgi:glycosyltransferase involved in cell wall biosynthesis
VGYLHAGASQAAAGRLRELGVEPELVPFRRLASVRDHRAVRAHLAAAGADVLHTHLRSADVVGGLAARSLGLPHVSTLHGFDWEARDWGGGARARASTRLVLAARRRLPRRIVAPSEALARGYLERTGDAPDHVAVVPSGSASHAAPGAGRAVRAELGIGPEEFVVALLSWLHPVKRHGLALAAAGDWRLLVVGDGPEAERLRRAAPPGAVFTGYRDDVMALLDAADLLLHPSRMEGFPIALLEAMAARVPIVATRVGGVPEIVEDGETGVLVDPAVGARDLAATVAGLRDDPARRAELAERALRRFEERFTAERWAQRLRDLYENELARPPA